MEWSEGFKAYFPGRRIIMRMFFMALALYPIAELMDGYLQHEREITLFADCYRLMLIFLGLLVIVRLRCASVLQSVVLWFSLLAGIWLLRILMHPRPESLVFDLSILVRSLYMALIIFFMALAMVRRNKQQYYIQQFYVVVLAVWMIITVSITVDYFFEIGQSTYSWYQVGRKFYFPANNELTFTYLVSWWVLFCRAESSLAKLMLSMASLLILLVIGTKSGIIMMLLLLYLRLGVAVYENFRLGGLYVMISLGFLTLAAWQIEAILTLFFDLMTMYSASSFHIYQKARLDGLFTALVGYRDLLMGTGVGIIVDYNFWEMLFGPGFYVYGNTFFAGLPTLSTSYRFAEIDGIDLLGGAGLLGLALYYGPLLVVLGLLISRYDALARFGYRNHVLASMGLLLSGLVVSNMTGHVMMQGFPMILIGLGYGLSTVLLSPWWLTARTARRAAVNSSHLGISVSLGSSTAGAKGE